MLKSHKCRYVDHMIFFFTAKSNRENFEKTGDLVGMVGRLVPIRNFLTFVRKI